MTLLNFISNFKLPCSFRLFPCGLPYYFTAHSCNYYYCKINSFRLLYIYNILFVFDCTWDAGVACVDQIKPFKVSFLHSLVCKQYQEYKKIVTINDDGM